MNVFFKEKPVVFAALFSTILFLFQNCTEVEFAKVESPGTGLCQDRKEVGCGDIHQTLKTLQPALAVRGVACLMCHADIRSNIVTDFGYGHSWYLGGTNRFDQDQSWYNNLASAWQTSRAIVGTVYLPNKPVTQSAQNILGSAYSGQPLLPLPEFFVTDYDVNWNHDRDPRVTRSSMSLRVQPLPGKSKVEGKSEIIIRAPNEQEIQNLSPMLFLDSEPSGFSRIGSSSPVQLSRVNSGASGYIINDSAVTLECENSDIVVKGTLFLRGLKVNAKNGCRLYVSGSVFIEDSIIYVGDGLQNLQISSASAIVMGIDVVNLRRRLVSDARGLQIGGPKIYSELASQVMSEAIKIGTLRDAASSSPRASIDYTGILLNAPIIHSRYLGRVKGTIVAEAALFALGAFHFEFDPVFTQVSVFPLLKSSILVAK